MKNEDQFEQRLRRQPLRPVPPAWREEILAAAEANRQNATTQSISEDQAALLAGWRLVFSRLPIAWATLAALWIVLIGLNLTLPSPIVRVAAQTPPAVRMESLAAWDFESADFEVLGRQLSPAPANSPATKDAVVPRRPHSERRRDADVGETHPKRWFDNIA
jgi:hypothetical protein